MPSDRSRLRVLEAALAVGLLLLIAVTIELIPGMRTLETTLGTVSAPGTLGPMLMFAPPTALALAALANALLNGLSVGSILTATLAVLTLALTALSLAALIFPTDGGVFMGHILVAVVAIPLAVVVLVRPVVDRVVHEELTPRLRSRLGH
ncbi:hypothetical protein [Natranaeroarchaeum aerophilus]|uniref:Uncharacterized protein n=1 Tax=Natranaeroarchaeum aerophilus TaxID=2917711 RepID=A0AAE3K4X5_9EURY|nr:hypothetical protein [Natranaeroarchaeum aerophilus]MCL9813613.1 hypothetical protein [Natranaeroarchaeum aerophilus]